MIPARYQRFVFAFVMAALMAFLMTFVITWINTGLDAQFPSRWLRAFVIAWPAAFVAVLAVSPFARRITEALVAGSAK